MQILTRKDMKNLLVAAVILMTSVVASGVHAEEPAGQGGKYGPARFMSLSGSSAMQAAGTRSNTRFRPLGEARRSHVKALPLHGGQSRAKITRLNDSSISHRVGLYHAKQAKIKEMQPLDLNAIEPEAVHRDLLETVPAPQARPDIAIQVEERADELAGEVRGTLETMVEELTFNWPVEGVAHHEISSPFGPRRHPVTGKKDFHAGIDIPAPKGTPVLAAADGEVSGAGTHPRLGRYVKITHADNSYTLYGHLHRWKVREGEAVLAGQQVGTVGSTGRSTGPHLDFSIRREGKPIDPLPLLAANTPNKTLAMLH